MDSHDQDNQPGQGYQGLLPDQGPPADQQPDVVQSKAEQQQQDHPQPQPHWQTNQPYQSYAFGFPPQPHQPQQQQQQPAGGGNQYQNYGMPFAPQFQHMSYGGYNFPPPPTQHGYQYGSPAPHLREGSQPPESQPEQMQHDQPQQFQPGAPQEFQQNPPQQFQHGQPQQFQQGPPQQFQQGPPQQTQPGNHQQHQYGTPPHFPGFPPHQYPYGWGPPGPMPGYPPQYFSGPMMQTSSHEPTPDPALNTPTTHHGHSDSPAAPPEQPAQHHGTYPMPPMMGSFPYPGPAHPYYNHPAPSMPPAAYPAVAQPTPEPPKPVPSPGPLPVADHTSPAAEHTSPVNDNASSRARSRTLTAPAEPHHRQTRSHGTPPAVTTPAPASTSAQTTTAEQTAAVRLLHATTTQAIPPPPYGPGATDTFYACSPETTRLHQRALEKTPATNIHAVKHTRDCSACSKPAGRSSRARKKKQGGCDRLWPCGACLEKDKRWGSCRYALTADEGCRLPESGAAATGPPAQSADVAMTDADDAAPGTAAADTNVPVVDPALAATPPAAAGLVSVQLPPDVLQRLLGNPQVLAALRGTGYAGQLAAAAAPNAAPHTPRGQERPTDGSTSQEQQSSPATGQQDSSPQEERTVGSDGPMTLGQLAALGKGEGEG